MHIIDKLPEIKIRYRVYFMSVVFAVLIIFSMVNFTIYASITKGVICIVLALFVLFELQHLIRFNAVFHNHHLALTGFILLLILIPAVDENNTRGRMWIFILPLVTFYTQNFRNSFIFIGSFIIMAVFTQMASYFNLIARQTPYTIEQIVVFLLVVLISYIYENIILDSRNTIKTTLYTDSLTGYSNRRQLIEDLELSRNSSGVIIVLINIDDFKEINDLFGSKTGDKVIRHLGELIKNQACLSDKNNVYRLYSDEFAVLFGCDEKEKCNTFCNTLLSDLSESFLVDEDEILLTVSIGVSDCTQYPLEQADIALKRAKANKEHVSFFDQKLRTREKYYENRQILLRLRKAIVTDNIIPYFQPVYDISDSRIARFESLVRLKDENTIHSPFTFLELSKRAKQYHIITERMLKKTFDAFKNNDYPFSINIGSDDIFNQETVNLILESIAEYDNPSRIMFELLETEKLEDCFEVQSFIREVKKYGCKIAVDDFGSGYSNFNYIISLNVDVIKIDASLIKDIDTDYNSQIITSSIVNFAKKMGIKTIAEYVHSEAVFNKIRELNIDYAQGYFIGKPEPDLLEVQSS